MTGKDASQAEYAMRQFTNKPDFKLTGWTWDELNNWLKTTKLVPDRKAAVDRILHELKGTPDALLELADWYEKGTDVKADLKQADHYRYLAYYRRGNDQFREHRYADALPDLKKACEKAAADASDFNTLAMCHGKIGQWDDAIKAYTHSIELDSKSENATGVVLNLLEALTCADRPELVLQFIQTMEKKGWKLPTEGASAGVYGALFHGLRSIALKLTGKDASQAELAMRQFTSKSDYKTVGWTWDELNNWLKTTKLAPNGRRLRRKSSRSFKEPGFSSAGALVKTPSFEHQALVPRLIDHYSSGEQPESPPSLPPASCMLAEPKPAPNVAGSCSFRRAGRPRPDGFPSPNITETTSMSRIEPETPAGAPQTAGNLTRREYLKTAAAAGAACLAPTIIPASALGRDGATAPGERIVLGAIGLGSRGEYDLKWMLREKDVQFVAICDARKVRREAIKQIADKHYGNSDCQMYPEMREFLATRADIDAVLIATGDRWHSLAAIMAMRAGKDVYSEKPSCMTIAEGRDGRRDGAAVRPHLPDRRPAAERRRRS